MDWEPAERVQKNDSGQFRALIGGEWVPVQQAQKNDVGQFRVMRESTPDLAEKIAGSAPVRFAIGAAEPVLGAAQLVANLLPGNAGKAVNEHLTQLNQMIDKGRGSNGIDVARLGGNLLSPVNAGLARVMPAGATTGTRVLTGAGAGAVGGAMSPVEDGGNFAEKKAAQIGVGALAGGVATPILGKLADALAPRIEALVARFNPDKTIAMNATASMQADDAINKAFKEIGANPDEFGTVKLAEIRKQVFDSLKSGKKIDAAALARKMDFETVGVQPTLGQITRDATQFARERNLRGVPGAGEPLQTRFDTQNQQLQDRIAALRGNPSEEYNAGKLLSDELKRVDDGMRGKVKTLYDEARASTGKDAEIPLAGLANDYANVLDRFGSKVPDGLRNQFKKYGLEGGNQTKLFTVESADQLIKDINDHVGADKATNTALRELRNAVKNAITTDGGVEDVFSGARKAAGARFSMQEAIPALEAAANGEAPDKFVQRYVINGNVDQVKKLADVLKSTNREAFDEARAQIGAKIARAAFGENTAGDTNAAPARLAKALRELGTEKLNAFYTPDEIAQLKTLSRVAAYINSTPSSAPVNTSNNIGAITGLASRVAGISQIAAIAHALQNTVKNDSVIRAAVNAEVPKTTAPLNAEQAKKLSRLLTYGGAAVGAASVP